MEYNSVAIADCDLKFAQSEGSFSGYGSVFNVKDSANDIIMPNAYEGVLKSGNPVAVYANHGWVRGDLPIGQWNGLKQDKTGLYGDAQLEMRMTGAKDAYYAMKSGLVNGLSVAIIPDKDAIERKDGVRIIHNIVALKEISIVTDPANSESRVTTVKFNEELEKVSTVREFEQFLRDSGVVSKASAQLVVARAKIVFGQGELGKGYDAKAVDEITARLLRFEVPIFK